MSDASAASPQQTSHRAPSQVRLFDGQEHDGRGLRSAISRLSEIGAEFHGRGWSLATSSNYSVVSSRDPLRLLITASSRHKGRLSGADFVEVDEDGRPIDPCAPHPSAETLLHVVAARSAAAGAVLHTHSVWGTLLSERYHARGALVLEGYEMQKGLAGVETHQQPLRMEIYENTQDIPELARLIEARLVDHADPLRHGFLIRRHGLYTWGRDLDEAHRHVETLEFLFEVVGRELLIGAMPAAVA